MKWIYPILLGVGSFSLMLWFAITQYNLASDSLASYSAYLLILHNGWGEVRNTFITKSSLSVTLLPVIIQKITHFDSILVFKLYSSFIMPFLAVVVYFITEKFAKPLFAFLATILILGTQVIFLRLPAYSQMGITTLFFSLIILVLLSEMRSYLKYSLLVILSILIALSHYSIAFMGIAILSGTLLVMLIFRRYVKYILVAVASLMLSTIVWNGIVTTQPLNSLIRTILHPSTEAKAYAIEKYILMKQKVMGRPFTAEELAGFDPEYQKMLASFDTIDMSLVQKRDTIIEQAFGKGLQDGSILYKIKWAVSWLGILALMAGSSLMFIKRKIYKIPTELIALMTVCLVLMLTWVVVPYISIAYGIGRLYFQASVILVVPLGVLMQEVAGKLKCVL